MEELLILVNEHDEQIGAMPKMEVHEKGLLHRAFSVFIFNSKLELLIQKRALQKYHSGGLWSNTVCSHPRDNEKTEMAVERRLIEEMGMTSPTKFLFSFIYNENLENGLTENELDHVYISISDELPNPNPIEVSEYKYVSIPKLLDEINLNPDDYTVWFKICLPPLLEKFHPSQLIPNNYDL